MAGFLSADQVRKVRIKGSKVLKFDALDGAELRVVKMSSSAQLETQQIQKAVAEGRAGNKDFLLFMVRNSCADMAGNMFTDEDARNVFDLLPLSDVTSIVNEAAKLIGDAVKVRLTEKGEAQVAAPEPLTELEKK